MKRFLKRWWRNRRIAWNNLCARCETELEISHYFNLGMYDTPEPQYFCPFCADKPPEFLELYEMLKKGNE